MPTWTGLGADDNWSTVLNWDTGVPTATTPALFTGAGLSGNKRCTITSGATCSNLDFTGYTAGVAPNTAVMTFTNALAVRGSITLSPTMGAFAGANGIIINNTGAVTHTSNGFAFNKSLTTTQGGGGGFIITFIGNWVVSSFTLTANGGNPFTFQGAGVMTVNGNLSLGMAMTGSTMTFKVATTATISTSGSGSFSGTLNLDAGANTITINNLVFAGNLNYVSPTTIVHTGLLTIGGNCNLDLQDVQFNNYQQNGNVTCTLISEANFNNVTYGANNGTGTTLNGVGRRLKCRGNFTASQINGNSLGNGTISLIGSGNISATTTFVVTNDFEINTVGTYTFTSNFFCRSFKKFGLSTVNAGLFTINFTAGGIIDSGNIIWYNVTIVGSTLASYQLDSLLTVSNNLLISSTTTLIGAYGFTTKNFTCSTPAAIITLQNIIANPLAEYTVTGVLTLLGSVGSRIVLLAAGSATFNATINPVGQLNYVSGTSPSIGMTLSQATGFSPAQLNPANRPVITGGVSPTFTITPAAGGIITPFISMRAGYKAKFTLVNSVTASQNLAYVQTQDIDSSAGQSILVFGSNGDDINNSTIALFRTLNWGPLIAPSGSVYYTFVS
jgi:hypothetical protein